jgi:hypothetical protein
MTKLCLSSLPHTWIIDIDGTILKHNGYKECGDQLLNGVREFWQRIPTMDTIILLSAREERYATTTLDFLRKSGIRYDHFIFGIPKGERILINDIKPTGLDTAYSINVQRDEGLNSLVILPEVTGSLK